MTRSTKPPPLREADFQEQVIDLAHLCGWRIHAERSARTAHGWATPIQGDPGWPDLVLLRPPRLLFIEVKSERGQVTMMQDDWLQLLAAVPGVEAHVLRPRHWGEIVKLLK